MRKAMRSSQVFVGSIGAAIGTLVLSPRQSAMANLLTNPGFETGNYTGWGSYVTGVAGGTNTVNNWYVGASGDAHTGSHAGDLALDTSEISATNPTATGYNGLYQNVTVTAGSAYVVSGWAKILSTTVPSFGYIQAQFLNSTGGVLSTYTSGNISGSTYVQYNATNAGDLSLTAPANAVTLQVQAVVAQTADSGGHTSYWIFDDFNAAATTPIISLSSSAPTTYGSQITNGTGPYTGTFSTNTNKLTVSGGSGSYKLAQATSITGSSGSGTPTDYIEANGFSPANDKEVYALDVVQASGAAATTAELNTLVADINSNTAYGLDATVASTSLASNPFGSGYDLFLTFASPAGTGDNFLGFDLTQDPNYSGSLAGLKVVAVAVVPEPTNLPGIAMSLAAMSTLSRRRARRGNPE